MACCCGFGLMADGFVFVLLLAGCMIDFCFTCLLLLNWLYGCWSLLVFVTYGCLVWLLMFWFGFDLSLLWGVPVCLGVCCYLLVFPLYLRLFRLTVVWLVCIFWIVVYRLFCLRLFSWLCDDDLVVDYYLLVVVLWFDALMIVYACGCLVAVWVGWVFSLLFSAGCLEFEFACCCIVFGWY